jgi:hypothetical protein
MSFDRDPRSLISSLPSGQCMSEIPSEHAGGEVWTVGGTLRTVARVLTPVRWLP